MQNTYHGDKDPQLTQNVKLVLPHLWNLMLRIKWNEINLTRHSAFHNNLRLFFHYTEGIFHKSRRNLFHWKKDSANAKSFFLVEEGGFEPPKLEAADLQSVPFGHSGTPPYTELRKRKLIL